MPPSPAQKSNCFLQGCGVGGWEWGCLAWDSLYTCFMFCFVTGPDSIAPAGLKCTTYQRMALNPDTPASEWRTQACRSLTSVLYQDNTVKCPPMLLPPGFLVSPLSPSGCWPQSINHQTRQLDKDGREHTKETEPCLSQVSSHEPVIPATPETEAQALQIQEKTGQLTETQSRS